MRFEFKPSFDRSVKSLSPSVKQEIKELCLYLVDVLSGQKNLSGGLGLKNETDNFRLTIYYRSIYNTIVLYKER
jgi:hypothetical protein